MVYPTRFSARRSRYNRPSAYMQWPRTCIVTKKLRSVIGSHIHYQCGNISETVQDGVVVTTDH